LVLGSGDERRTRIPVGPGGGELVTFEPVAVPVTGLMSMELIDLAFTSGEVRAGIPANHSHAPDGQLALTLNFDVTNRRSGSWSLFATDFALIGPDGTATSPHGSNLASMQGSEEGIVTTDFYVRFLINDPPSGTYTLQMMPGSWFVGDDGVDKATFEFSLS